MLDLSNIYAKVETVPGTDIVPAAATDAFIVSNYQVTPMESQEVRRNIDLPYPGARPSLPTAIHAKHSFDIELSGSGVAATATKWGSVLLRACMFDVPTVAADVTYPLDSVGDGKSLSLYGFKDSAKHVGLMTRGNWSMEFTEKQLPKLSLDYMALLPAGVLPMVSGAPGTPTLPTYPAPVEVGLTNTVFTLDGTVLGVRSFKIDGGMKTSYYSHTGARAIIYDKADDGDRRAITATLVAELPDPATKNYFTTVLAGTVVTMNLVHGITVGNIITLNSAKAVIGAISYTVENNRLYMNCKLTFVPSAAGNELTLKTA